MRIWMAALAIGLVAIVLSGSVYAAAEKGSRCSDGIDNDGDTLVDGDDPDCGNSDANLESRVVALEQIVADHEIRISALEGGQSESFDSEASAAANGWMLFNGLGNWGWQNSSLAGGEPGEARADSYVAGEKRWYADVDLKQDLSFDQDWYAEGKMDFPNASASDGGMFFGFFDRGGSFPSETQVLAGFLLVNSALSVRFERRPDVSFIDSTYFNLWQNDDHTFSLVYDADGGPEGFGRLTGSLTDSFGTIVAYSIDIPLAATEGAVLDSFGFYATDVYPGRTTNFDWVVDDLEYGSR